MMERPSPQLLDRLGPIAQDPELPLHVQVRRGLSNLIDDYFEDGQPFWTENLLTERLNVSRITVRRALADLKGSGILEREVPKGTIVRKSVRKTVAEPVLQTVGVILSWADSALIIELLERLTELCRTQKLKVRTYYVHPDNTADEICAGVEGSPRDERIVLLGTGQHMTATVSRSLADRGYRGVMVDMLAPDSPWSYIGTDNEIGMRLGVEHLLALGHRRITLLVNEPEEALTVQARIAAFQQICRDADQTGAYPIVICQTEHHLGPFDAAYRNMERVMETNPTAIFAVSDSGALGALRYLSENGIAVPRQMSVIGFDDERPSRFSTPALTAVAHPMAELMAGAIALLQENGGNRRFLPPTLSIRQSTAAPAL